MPARWKPVRRISLAVSQGNRVEVGTLQMEFSPGDGMRQQDDVRSWRERRRRREGSEWPTEPLADPWEADEDDRDGERHDEPHRASAYEPADTRRVRSMPQ